MFEVRDASLTDTVELLGDVGMTEQEIENLRSRGVVG
jgi:hypothetical protein